MKRNRFAAPLLAALLALAAGATMLAVPTSANAQSREWEIQSRIRQTHDRIQRNVDRGALSRRDARRLMGELDDIRDAEIRMRRDGRLDRREREILDRRLDRLNREISIERRN